jgi:hypothetical protein
MEDEELLNDITPVKDISDVFSKKYGDSRNRSKIANIDDVSSSVGFNTGIGDSEYDKGFLPHLADSNNDFTQALSKYRAKEQPTSHKVGSALGRLINVIPEAIGTTASALDFEDYFNSDDEVGNWLTDITESIKQSVNEDLPIYRENPGESLDFGDVGWWLENGSALGQSIGGFALGGGAITKSLSGLSKLTKAKKLATIIAGSNKAEKLGNIVQTGVTATMLNQAEAILEANSVYDEIYNETLQKLNEDNPINLDLPGQLDQNKAAARQKAAEASSATINANRVNILLNLSSANLFLKSPKLTRNLLSKPTVKGNLATGAIEGGQESVEEFINFISGEYGRAVGRDQEYGFNEILDALGKPEAHEAALLGFFGGLGQTVATKEGINRLSKTIDPETGKKISVKDYNKQSYQRQKDIIDQYDANSKDKGVKNFTDTFNNLSDNIELYSAYEKALTDNNTEEANKIRQLTLNNQAYNAFQNGTTESLVGLYEELRNGDQKEGMESNYKEKATKAISKIQVLEKLYNDSAKYENHQQVYINRAHNIDLHNQNEQINDQTTAVKHDLELQIAALTQYGPFSTVSGQNAIPNTYTLDINNIDFNPAKEGGDKKAITEFETLQKIVKESPQYKDLQDLAKVSKDLKTNIKNNLKDYSKITSEQYQNEYKNKVENIRDVAEKQVEKQVDEVENEIKKDEVVAKENKRVEDIAEVNNQVAEKVSKHKENIESTKANINTLADNYNVGEFTDLGHVFGIEYEGQVGSITEVYTDAKGARQIKVKTLDGKILSTEDSIDPNFMNNDILDIYNTEGSEASNTSNEDSIKKSEEASNKVDKVKNGNKLSDVKLLSTYRDSDKLLQGIPQSFLDYERNPVDKIGTKVNFEINTDIDTTLIKANDFKKAIRLFNDFKSGKELSKPDIDYMIDYLPLKAKINNSDVVYTFLESKPNSTNPNSLEAYNNRSRPLRISIINQVKEGIDINSIFTTIKGQYGGQIQMDNVTAENSILDLDYIDNKVENVEFFVLDENGQLRDSTYNYAKGWNKTKDKWKGSVYIKIKLANGKDFYLNLNFSKVSKPHANAIFDIYKSLVKDIKPITTLNKLDTALQTSIKNNLKVEIDLLKKVGKKQYNDITVTEILDLLIWDGSVSEKSKIGVDYKNKRMQFGYNSYPLDQFTEDKRTEFVEWVTTSKNRNLKFKSKPSDIIKSLNITEPNYVKYVIDSKILTTNAKVNTPTFAGFTNLYLNNGIAGKTAVAKPKVIQKQALNNKGVSIENGSQGDFNKDGYFAFNDNSDHSQDSVRVYNGWAMVADGVSSNKNSKEFADALLREISKDEALDTVVITNIIDDLSKKYSDAAATLSMVKKNPDGTFTYFTLGDSQVIVVDKNGNARQTFAQLDKNGDIDYGNSTHAAVAGHGVNGKFQTGRIKLRLGEKIVIASDGIIDVLQYRDGKDKDIVDFYNTVTKVFPKDVLTAISESSFEEVSAQINDLVNGDSTSKSKNATAILLSLEKVGLLYDTMLNNPTLINKLALLSKGDDNSFIILDNNFNISPSTPPKIIQKGFRKSTDTNLKFADVDGKKYYASADSGRVFVNKALDKVDGRTPYVHEQVGELITDVNLINKIEANIRGNMFAGAPNIKLHKVNNTSINTVKEFEKVVGKHTFIQKNVKGKAGIVNHIVKNNDTGAEIIKATKPDGSVTYFAIGNFPGLPEGFNGLANSKEEVNDVLMQLDIEISNFLGLNNKKSENKSENIRISQNNLVPLQENKLSEENEIVKKQKSTIKKPSKKLSMKEIKAKALEAKNKLNKKCK